MLNLRVDGAKLRTIREDAGLSVAALADRVDCSIWNIYRIENGNGQPSAELYARLRTALAATNGDLLERTEGAA